MFSSDSNLNDAKYADQEYDRLLEAAARKEGSERLDALAEAENRLLSTAVVMPLYHNLAANVVDTSYILGWYPNVLDLHPFKYLSFGEKAVRSNVAKATPAPALPQAPLPRDGAAWATAPFIAPAATAREEA